jgi:hypothetical protein
MTLKYGRIIPSGPYLSFSVNLSMVFLAYRSSVQESASVLPWKMHRPTTPSACIDNTRGGVCESETLLQLDLARNDLKIRQDILHSPTQI